MEYLYIPSTDHQIHCQPHHPPSSSNVRRLITHSAILIILVTLRDDSHLLCLTLIRMTKDEKVLAIFKGLML